MILVTGGTGLVGSHLLYQLVQENDRVVAIHRKNSDLQRVKRIFSYYSDDYETLFLKIQWKQADITDVFLLEKAFEGVKYVYHASALVSFNLEDYKKMRKINIEGTKNVINLCIDKKIKKLCFVSSIATLGNTYGKNKIDEDSEWGNEKKPSGYAITKHGAEMEVYRASQEGVSVVIVNPGVILGAGFWDKGTGEIFSRVDKGLRFYTTGVTGYVYVKDVARAMILLMKSSIKNQRFVLVAENKSFQEVLNSIAKELHKKKPTLKVSPLISEMVWRLSTFFSLFTRNAPLLNKQTARSIHHISYYSSQKIKDTLQFEFMPIKKVIKEVARIYNSKM